MGLKRTGCLILAYGCLGLIVYSMFHINVVPIDGMWKTLLCVTLGFLATGHIFSMLSGELTRNHPNTQHAKAVASTIKFIGFFVALLVFLFLW